MSIHRTMAIIAATALLAALYGPLALSASAQETSTAAAAPAAQPQPVVPGAGYILPQMSPESKACADCHKVQSPSIYEEWGASKHFRGNIGCMECHRANKDDVDAWVREGGAAASSDDFDDKETRNG